MSNVMRLTAEAKRLIMLCHDNGVGVFFGEVGSLDHGAREKVAARRKGAQIYEDMDLRQIENELKDTLKANGIEPNKFAFDALREFYGVIQGGVLNE